METQSARSARRSTLRPSQQKRKAALLGKPPIRRKRPRTPSSESGVPRRRIDRHVLSSTSNSASVLVPVKRRNLRRAYIISHARYHGHRRRHGHGTAHNAAQPPQDPYTFNIFFLSGPYYLKALSDRLIIGPVTGRKHQGSKKL